LVVWGWSFFESLTVGIIHPVFKHLLWSWFCRTLRRKLPHNQSCDLDFVELWQRRSPSQSILHPNALPNSDRWPFALTRTPSEAACHFAPVSLGFDAGRWQRFGVGLVVWGWSYFESLIDGVFHRWVGCLRLIFLWKFNRPNHPSSLQAPPVILILSDSMKKAPSQSGGRGVGFLWYA